jgi:amidase
VRRRFPRLRRAICAAVAVAALAASATASAAPPASIAALRADLEQGRTTCHAVVAEALERIREVESSKPRPRAVVETNPDALAIADSLDAEQRSGAPLRPLHCVTLLVKDNFETADRLSTTVGSLVMRGFHAVRDALVVARLREAGAVVLGKTNMDEWAHGATGYSSRGGQTRNALRPARVPGGSSGGSAVAVALHLALVATGSDTGGSIQIPASYNGVVGLRGTMGLVSRAGVVPYASISDVPGPITGSVEDLARTLGVLTGVDPADPATAASEGHSLSDYTPFLDATGLQGARIGVLRKALGVPLTGDNDDVDRTFDEALATMRAAGATVVDGLTIPGPERRWIAVGIVAQRQFRPELDAWFATSGRSAPVQSLAQVVARSRRPGIRGRVRILHLLESDLAAPPARGPAYRRALAQMDVLRADVLELMRRYDLDALVYPNSSCPAPPLPGVVDPTYECRGVEQPLGFGEGGGSPAALLSPATGLPVLSLPGGRLPGGLRLGLTLLGEAWSEGELIRLGYAFEQAHVPGVARPAGRPRR